MNSIGTGISLSCACTLLFTATQGCALFAKGEPGAARFFSLERTPTRPGAPPVGIPLLDVTAAHLRLGRVSGAPHLEERLVFRNSAYEINYYRERRWTEPPELFLQRLLARVLFEERGLGHAAGGTAPTLDVELTTFDEIRAPQRLARAQVIARLRDERLVLWEETLTVDHPVLTDGSTDLALATVEALGEAMQEAVDRIADHVVRELETREAAAREQKSQKTQLRQVDARGARHNQ